VPTAPPFLSYGEVEPCVLRRESGTREVEGSGEKPTTNLGPIKLEEKKKKKKTETEIYQFGTDQAEWKGVCPFLVGG